MVHGQGLRVRLFCLRFGFWFCVALHSCTLRVLVSVMAKHFAALQSAGALLCLGLGLELN
jgi:hypothetical protein